MLPLSLLSTRDVAAIRDEVTRRAALRWMWWSPTQMFDANVRVWAGVWEVGGRQGEVRRALRPDFEPLPAIADAGAVVRPASADTAVTTHGGPVLGDIATFTADFRDQYYGLIGAVSDDGCGPPLITSGLIEPDECLWGRRPVRFAKQRYAAPRVDVSSAVTGAAAMGRHTAGAEDPDRQPDQADRGGHRP